MVLTVGEEAEAEEAAEKEEGIFSVRSVDYSFRNPTVANIVASVEKLRTTLLSMTRRRRAAVEEQLEEGRRNRTD